VTHPHERLGSVPADHVGVEVTTARVVAAIVAIYGLLLALVVAAPPNAVLALVRAVVAVAFLTIVPGYLLVRLIGVRPPRPAETVVYVVALSLTALMAGGVAINYGLYVVGLQRPLAELPLVLSIGAIVLLLTGLYATRVDDRWSLTVPSRTLTSPVVLGLSCLPVLGVYGALLLTRFDSNILLLVVYAAIAAVPLLAVRGVIPQRYYTYAIWTVALTLLLQNTLTGRYLAWGDQPKEAALALDVMRSGVWLPSQAPAFGAKYSMLRIVILHPIYAFLTDLKLVWVFKLVHPLLFSLTPVALYRAYENYVDADVAFISTYLFMSLFSFFVVLSRNTRTATAILFLAILALLIADDALDPARRQPLALLVVSSIVVSHYGVSYMVLFALLAIYPVRKLLDARTGKATRTVTTPAFVLLYLSVTFAWYIFASPNSKSFGLVVGFAQNFTDRLASTFLTDPGSTSASTRYLTSDFVSITLEAVKFYNVLLGAVMVFGVVATAVTLLRDPDDVAFDTEYFVFAGVFLGLFAVTFLPVERFNTARTYPTTLLFFAPFFVIGVRELLDVVPVGTPDATTVKRVGTVLVLGYFLLNVGFVSATVTHEHSPNALVEKDRIMDDGHPTEKTYFYKQYPTDQDVRSSAWLRSTAIEDERVYQSGWPGGMTGAVGHQRVDETPPDATLRRSGFSRGMFEDGARVGPGYLYLNTYSDYGGVIRLPAGHFEFSYVRTDEIRAHWDGKSRVYSNGRSSVYY